MRQSNVAHEGGRLASADSNGHGDTKMTEEHVGGGQRRVKEEAEAAVAVMERNKAGKAKTNQHNIPCSCMYRRILFKVPIFAGHVGEVARTGLL